MLKSLKVVEMIEKFENFILKGNIEKANSIWAELPEFPKKQRLKGKLMEARGDFLSALSTYNQDQSPECIKLKAMCFWSFGDVENCIKTLTDYLQIWMTDSDAWFQLSIFYISLTQFDFALFSLQEVLILNPANHLYLLKYADLVFAMGNREDALKYYCASVEIYESVYGWVGVLMSSGNQLELKQLASAKLREEYKDKSSCFLIEEFIIALSQ